MSERTINRWGGVALSASAVLLALGGVLAAIVPGGGLEGPLVPLLYYLGTVISAPAVTALYATHRAVGGRLAFAGYVLAVLGAILYTGPQLALLAGTSGVATWHDIWGFSMVRFPVLTFGAPAFMIGLILLGVTIARARILPAWSGWLLAVGAVLWLIAFVVSMMPGLLTVASLLTGIGLFSSGLAVWSGPRSVRAGLEPA